MKITTIIHATIFLLINNSHLTYNMDLVRSLSGGSKKQSLSLTEKIRNESRDALFSGSAINFLFVIQNAKKSNVTEETIKQSISQQKKMDKKDSLLFVALHRIEQYNQHLTENNLLCITSLGDHAEECYTLYLDNTDIRHRAHELYGLSFSRSDQHKATAFPTKVPNNIAFDSAEKLISSITNITNDYETYTLIYWNTIIKMILAKQKQTKTKSNVNKETDYYQSLSEAETQSSISL